MTIFILIVVFKTAKHWLKKQSETIGLLCLVCVVSMASDIFILAVGCSLSLLFMIEGKHFLVCTLTRTKDLQTLR